MLLPPRNCYQNQITKQSWRQIIDKPFKSIRDQTPKSTMFSSTNGIIRLRNFSSATKAGLSLPQAQGICTIRQKTLAGSLSSKNIDSLTHKRYIVIPRSMVNKKKIPQRRKIIHIDSSTNVNQQDHGHPSSNTLFSPTLSSNSIFNISEKSSENPSIIKHNDTDIVAGATPKITTPVIPKRETISKPITMTKNIISKKTNIESSRNAGLIGTHILDEIFDTNDPKNIISQISDIAMKDWAYVNANTPVVTKKYDIHGTLSIMLRYCFTSQFLKSTPVVHRCEYFTGFYFPPWHLLSLCRKTRPAFTSLFSSGEEFNGNQEMANNKSLLVRRSKNPMSYASSRKYITNSSRDALFDAFYNVENSVDGLYLIRSHKYPEKNPYEYGLKYRLGLDGKFESTEEENSNNNNDNNNNDNTSKLYLEFEKYVKKSAEMATNTPMTWVDKFNSKVEWNIVNNRLLKPKHYLPLVKMRLGQGLHWRQGQQQQQQQNEYSDSSVSSVSSTNSRKKKNNNKKK